MTQLAQRLGQWLFDQIGLAIAMLAAVKKIITGKSKFWDSGDF